MRTRLPFVAVIAFFLISCSAAFAQGGKEALVSLKSNAQLGGAPANQPFQSNALSKTSFGKTSIGQRFPFIERFNYSGTELTDSLWASPKSVKKANRAAVFNALNASGAPYLGGNGSFGETDVLVSQDLDIRGSDGQLYIAFAYSTGSTWQAGDSLTLEIETPSGNYNTVWTSFNSTQSNFDVRIPLDFQLYNSASLNFRMKCYTTALTTNTETFLVHWVVLADKIALPYYENFPEADTSLYPSPALWQQAQTLIADSLSFTPGTQVVVFDSKDELGVVYNNSGFADTLHSQPVNLTLLLNTDSVYLRFYYKAMPAAGNNDSLILEFLNNLGSWVRVWQTGAAGARTNFIPFIQQVNTGRFRHANFQYRLINKCTYATTDTMQFIATGFHMGRKLPLPFIDDFSSTNIYPSAKRWLDRDVYINNNFGVRAPSVNVATFDGLDERGNAYGRSGYLDTLTSVAINLNGLLRSDSTYLSFFIEPKGLGYLKPDAGDSLVLEFRSLGVLPNAWTTVWNASSTNYPGDRFTQIFLLVDSSFLHDDFQFRFKNIGDGTGNLFQWHVDYIRLNKSRNINDAFQDFAVTASSPPLLKKYSSMPRSHYNINPSAYTNTLQSLGISNNSASAFPLTYWRKIFDPANNLIDSFGNTSGFVPAVTDTTVSVLSTPALATTLTADSLIFTSTYTVSQNLNFDNIPTNDSLSVRTIFSNYFAYDDGTAEAGYGIEFEPGAVALGFNLEVADTLQGLSMFFNQSYKDVSTQSFNLMVWSAVGTGGNGLGEIVLKRLLQSRPTYVNQLNGFYYLKFDQPLVLPAGPFYIGWEQTSVFQLNMGFDNNYQVNGAPAKNPDMYFRLQDGIWQRTKIEGALMMRPIIGKWMDPPVGIKEEKEKARFDVLVYPNPASDMLYIRLQSKEAATAQLFDLAGKMIISQTVSQNELHLPSLSEGLYLLKVTEQSSGNTIVKKIIIKQ